jgi:plasmid replication initiation protein
MTESKIPHKEPVKSQKLKSKEVVVKSNDLINASYKLSLNEHRLILGAIGRVDATKALSEGKMFRVEVQHIADLCEVSSTGNLYRDMRQAATRLFRRSIVIKGDMKQSFLRWVWRVDYFDKEGAIGLYFSPDVIPYISTLNSKFAKYRLEDVAKFRSAYSYRVYELLAQWQGIGYREIAIEELRELLCLEGKYKRWAELKRNVIDTAILEINEHSNLSVSYGYRKQSRRIVAIQFRFSTKTTGGGKSREQQIEEIARPGEQWKEAAKRLDTQNQNNKK